MGKLFKNTLFVFSSMLVLMTIVGSNCLGSTDGNAEYWQSIGLDFNIDMDWKITVRQELRVGKSGDDPYLHNTDVGLVYKGFADWFTVLAIRDELDGIDKSVSAKRIKAYFEGIRPSFVRRDKDFFGENKTLQTAADAALDRLVKADSADYLTARREIEDVIARTYGLCVLFEIMEVENLRNSDLAKCEVKKMEAVVFYRIIEPRIIKRSPKIAEIISYMLNGNYATMNSSFLEKTLEAGLVPVSLR